jgi:hypothetical protein
VQRRLCGAILGLEAIVLGLSTLVLVPLSSVSDTAGLTIGLGLLVACLLIAGLLRFRWAFALGWLVQVAALALGFVVGAMFVLGAIFLVLWATAYLLGRRIEIDRAAWEARAGEGPPAH